MFLPAKPSSNIQVGYDRYLAMLLRHLQEWWEVSVSLWPCRVQRFVDGAPDVLVRSLAAAVLVLLYLLGSAGSSSFARSMGVSPSRGASRDRDEFIIWTHHSRNSCERGAYEHEGQRKEGWHRQQGKETYPCTPGSSASGSSGVESSGSSGAGKEPRSKSGSGGQTSGSGGQTSTRQITPRSSGSSRRSGGGDGGRRGGRAGGRRSGRTGGRRGSFTRR